MVHPADGQRSLWVLLLGGCYACSGGDAPGGGFLHSDSAGVEIVETWGPPSAGLPGLDVDTLPLVSIGAVDGEEYESFSWVPGARRLSDGTIVLVEASVPELRFFDGTGAFIRRAGGSGDGPGEAQWVADVDPVRVLAGDTILLDAGTRHLYFSKVGEYLGEVRVDQEELARLGPWAGGADRLLPDRSLLRSVPIPGRTQFIEYQGSQNAPDSPRDESRLVRVSPDLSRIDTLGLHLGPESLGLPHPFLRRSWIAAGPSGSDAEDWRVYVALNTEYSIEAWTPGGRLERIIRRNRSEREPTDAERETAWAETRGAFLGSDQDFERRRASFPGHSTVPPVHGLWIGVDGDVWVRREPFLQSQQQSLFDVFDSSGRFLTSIRLPGYVWIYEVGPDYLLTARLDEMMIPFIQLLRLHRGGIAR